MDYRYLHLFCPLMALGINIILQVLNFRLDKRHKLLQSVFIGFAAGILSVLAIDGFIIFSSDVTIGHIIPEIFVDMMTYCAFGYCYFHFINLGETARRIRLLRELAEAPSGLTEEQFLSRYGAKDIVGIRLERLLNNNQIVLSGGRYYVGSPAMLFISKILFFMKAIILGTKNPI